MTASTRAHHPDQGSASAAAMAVLVLTATLMIGVLKVEVAVAGVRRRLPWTPDAVSQLAETAEVARMALEDTPGARPSELERAVASAVQTGHLRADPTSMPPRFEMADLSSRAILADASDNSGAWGPLHPVVHSMARIRNAYETRTGSAPRADSFIHALESRISEGYPLSEDDIRAAAGIDYAMIQGIITGEPLVNIDSAPAPLLADLGLRIAPDSPRIQATVTSAVRALIGLRETRVVTAADVAAVVDQVLLESAAELTPDEVKRLAQLLSAYLGVRTWVWQLTVHEADWKGRAVIAWLPGRKRPTVLGLGLEDR